MYEEKLVGENTKHLREEKKTKSPAASEIATS